MKNKIIEKVYDELGNLLWEKPYPFTRLPLIGQEMIERRIPMTVLDYKFEEKNGMSIITTKVKLHKPWPQKNEE